MGTFEGHFFNGIAFIVMSLWWTVNLWRDYFRSRCRGGPKFRGCFSFPASCTRGLPIESVFFMASSLNFIVFELWAVYHQDTPEVQYDNAQHIPVAICYALAGLEGVLRYYRIHLPNGSDQAVWTLAFVVQAFAFANHKHGKPPSEQQAHLFLVYSIVATVAFIYLEARDGSGVIASLSRSCFVLVQGTWLIQIGFMFFPIFGWWTKWSDNDPNQMVQCAVIFSVHCIVAFMVVCAEGVLVYYNMSSQGALSDFEPHKRDSEEKRALLISVDCEEMS